MTYVVFPLLGLGNGAVYAALALSLILVFRSSGVINFATGAMAMYGAYTFAVLRNEHALVNPVASTPAVTIGVAIAALLVSVLVPHLHERLSRRDAVRKVAGVAAFVVLSRLPLKVSLGGTVPFPVALVLALAVSTALGLVLYHMIFRHLRDALPLTKVVASLGVMTFLQGIVALRLGVEPPFIQPIFPVEGVKIANLIVRKDVLIFFAVITLVVALAWAGSKYTRFGRATTAAAESEKGAMAIGLSPDAIAFTNWGISGFVAGLSGILIAPLAQVNPGNYTLFVVPAMAAALVGSFTAIWPSFFVAVGLGMVQSEVVLLRSKDWFPSLTGLGEAIPFLVIILVMMLRGRPLPERGVVLRRTMPLARPPRGVARWAVIGTAVTFGALVLFQGGYRSGVIATLVFSLNALSLVVITGFVGQISLAQFAFSGFSALLLSKFTLELGIPFPIAPLLAALCAALLGVVIGAPALRVRGVNLAVLTLGAAVAVDQLLFRNPSFNGGPGGAPMKPPSLFGTEIRYPHAGFGVFALVVVVLVALGVAGLRRSRLGYQMLAVRANERAAAAAGVNVAAVKLIAFAISAFIAGIAGAVYAYQFPAVSADNFAALAGIGLFTTAYLAGVTSVSGGLTAGFISGAGLLNVVLNRQIHIGRYHEVVAALGLILVALRQPDGISGDVQHVLERRRAARARPPEEPAPARDPELVGA